MLTRVFLLAFTFALQATAVLSLQDVDGIPVQVSVSKDETLFEYNSTLCAEKGPGFAYWNKTKSCHLVGTQGPCPDNLTKFVQSRDNRNIGECVCNFRKVCGRPVVQWPENGRCYFVYSQGPCNETSWLTLNESRSPECTPNECRAEMLETPKSQNTSTSNNTATATSPSSFWFSHNGSCYQTGTRGFCEHPEARLFFRQKDTAPSCNFRVLCGRTNGKFLRQLITEWKLYSSRSDHSRMLGDDQTYTNTRRLQLLP